MTTTIVAPFMVLMGLIVALIVAGVVFGLVKLFSSRQARETARLVIMIPLLVLGSLLLAFLVLAGLYTFTHVERRGAATVAEPEWSPIVDRPREVKIPVGLDAATAAESAPPQVARARSSVPARVLHAVQVAFVDATRKAADRLTRTGQALAGKAVAGGAAPAPAPLDRPAEAVRPADFVMATPAKPASEAVSEPKPAVAEVAAAAPPTSAPTTTRPVWVDHPPQPSEGAYEVAVKAGPWKTRLECEQAMADEVDWAVETYVAWKIGEEARSHVRLPHDYLRREVIRQQWLEKINTSLGEMFNLHALLRFDGQTDKLLQSQWGETLAMGRVVGSGAILGAVLVLLTVVWGYLKIDLATAGAYRWRLRLAAAALILAVGAAGARLLH